MNRARHTLRRRGFRLAAVAALLLAATPTIAAVNCSTSSPTLAFGNYDPTVGTPTDITGTMTVTCTRAPFDTWTVSYTLELSTGGSGTYANRRMRPFLAMFWPRPRARPNWRRPARSATW